MKGKILKIPSVTWDSSRKYWILTSELIWEDDENGKIVVPVGYHTNFASVPRIPLIFTIFGGRANIPAILHDYLYEYEPHINKETADKIFLAAMKSEDDPSWAWQRRMMYLAVRLFGRPAYAK